MPFYTIEDAENVGLVKYYMIYVLIDTYAGLSTENFAIFSTCTPTTKSCDPLFRSYEIDGVIGVTGSVEITRKEYDQFWQGSNLKPVTHE